MKHLASFVILIGTSLLIGCASVKPQGYDFQSVAIKGQQYRCGDSAVVLPEANHPFPMWTGTCLSRP
jgi:hypothetical protein